MNKKNTRNLIVVGILAFSAGISGCKKEQIASTLDQASPAPAIIKEYNLSVVDNRLNFKTLADYEKLINEGDRETFIAQANSIPGFTSLMKSKGPSVLNSDGSTVVDDALVRSFLNKDNTFQAGEYIFTLNGEEKTVNVLNTTDKSEVKYSFDEPVLDILTGVTSRCSETSRSTNENTFWTDPFFNGVYLLSVKSRNYNGGVIFTLGVFATLKIWNGVSWVNSYHSNVRIREEQIYTHRKPRCQSWESSWEAGTVEPVTAEDNTFERIPYSRSRGLHKYKIQSEWSGSGDNGATWGNKSALFVLQANY